MAWMGVHKMTVQRLRSLVYECTRIQSQANSSYYLLYSLKESVAILPIKLFVVSNDETYLQNFEFIVDIIFFTFRRGLK